jgi:hypothetical protein
MSYEPVTRVHMGTTPQTRRIRIPWLIGRRVKEVRNRLLWYWLSRHILVYGRLFQKDISLRICNVFPGCAQLLALGI